MLGKLLKYDLKKTMSFLVIFYSIALFLSILTRFFINEQSPFIVFIIGRILSGAVISMFANILINCLMGNWIRSFARGVYGDESYLTHTLPVTKKQIYLSKLFCAVISSVISVIVIFVCAFIAYYTDARWQIVKHLLFMEEYTTTITLFCILTIILEFISLIQCGFTGIILGHKLNSGKAGLSVLFGVVAETVSQLFILSIMGIAALLNDGFKTLFTSSPDNLFFKNVFYLVTPVYFLIIIGMATFNIKMLNKGVDIE